MIPPTLNDLVSAAGPLLKANGKQKKQQEVLEWLDLLSSTRALEDEPPFIKLRMHLFQRVLHGLWGCVDRACPAKNHHIKEWPFGNVYLTQRSECECGAPVYEIAFCDDCKHPHIVAEDVKGRLQQSKPYSGDEFSLLDDEFDDNDSSEDSFQGNQQSLILGTTTTSNNYIPVSIDLDTRQLGIITGERVIDIHITTENDSECCSCGFKGSKAAGSFLRKSYLGAPFFVSHAVPTVLEFCPEPNPKDIGGVSPNSLPGHGKKLITFTDSRQGTARMAVRMQQEAERSKLRGLVFQILRNHQSLENAKPKDIPTGDPEELLDSAEMLEKQGMMDMARQLREKAAVIRTGGNLNTQIVVSWSDLVDELAKINDIKYSILDYNRYANPQFFGNDAGGKTLARLLLMREFSRRPKNQNSSETLGLVKVGYKGLEQVTAVPEHWQQTVVRKQGSSTEDKHLSLQDWKDFLKVALDFYVRENTFIRSSRDEQNWMGSRFAPKELFAPGYQYSDTRSKAWPSIQNRGQYSRLIKVLALGADLNLENATHKNIINVWLKAAWSTLINSQILQSTGNGYALSHHALEFSLPTNAWICPITNRLIDTTFRGFTPYLPRTIVSEKYSCERIELPDFTALSPAGEPEGVLKAIRKKVSQNKQVQNLREQGLWSDISDRTAEGGFYYRTAEHSAQQSADRLQNYEADFKAGNINVLNCSTTMEMGVDIGGVSAVVMNNAPPHPANYLQRAGRAGRRNEARAIAYTLCKPDPHNTRLFHNPKWPFETAIPAPIITLTAEPLVQRHVNSFLLANFLCTEIASDNDDRTRLTVQWFFAGHDSPSQQFIDYLSNPQQLATEGLKNIIRGTVIEAKSLTNIFDMAKQKITELANLWRNDYLRINQRFEQATEPAFKKAMELEKRRHEEEYLLRDLAARAFLPGYGFPTDIVNLSTYNIEDFKDRSKSRGQDSSREDNIFQYKEKPSRDLSIAIREYAPGAQIVLDGRVFRSAGVEMQTYHREGNVQKFDLAWRCHNCGIQGYKEYAYLNEQELVCHECHSEIHPSEIKKILRPAGFVTDFYESTTNDVSSQKFIQVNQPRITIQGNTISLPDERCGFVSFGENGHVFHHSSGEYQNGYAICMACGRAESMTASDELPAALKPDKDHRPIGGEKGGNKEKNCSGERVMPNVHLGYQTRTHVLEIALKNPMNGDWIPTTEDGKVIANTLAVALRDSLADTLAVSSTEMGFGVRQDKDLDSGRNRMLIQVYDNVAGGAGFVLTGLENLMSLLFKTFEKLECLAHCENVCSACLAGQDSRVEQQPLNRKGALEWVQESQIKQHLNSPEPFSTLDGAKYWAYEPKRFIRHWINKGSTSIVLPLTGDTQNWDLTHPDFRNELISWRLIDNLDVVVILDKEIQLDTEIKDALSILEKIGVHLEEGALAPQNNQIYTAVQLLSPGGKTQTLMTNNSSSLQPDEDWFCSDKSSLWVSSSQEKPIKTTPIDTVGWHQTPTGAGVIEVKTELNVSLPKLKEAFKALLHDKAKTFSSMLEGEKVVSIDYQDRYLKSPWNTMVLMALLEAFRHDELKQLSISTIAENRGGRNNYLLWHNWPNSNDMKNVLSQWIKMRYELEPHITVHQNLSDLPHRRILTLGLTSGKKIKLVFDQGVGYWEASTLNRDNNSFDFDLDTDSQMRKILTIWPDMKLRNTGDWPTDISIYE